MDNRKLIFQAGSEPHCQSQIYQEDGDRRTIALTYSDQGGHTAEEIVKRWNAYPELVTALADMVSTAKEVEHMMDGDKDKQEAWAEELGRLYVALDAAKALLNTL